MFTQGELPQRLSIILRKPEQLRRCDFSRQGVFNLAHQTLNHDYNNHKKNRLHPLQAVTLWGRRLRSKLIQRRQTTFCKKTFMGYYNRSRPLKRETSQTFSPQKD